MAVPSPAIHGNKAALRAELRETRRVYVEGLTPQERRKAAERLQAVVAPRLENARIVAAYLPIGCEIDPLPIIDWLSGGFQVALPYVTGRDDTPRFLGWTLGDPLVRGPLGLSQPAADAAEVEPDTILTPLLGFDRALNRIGYGAGHYDRAFARHPSAHRIGIAWAVQAVEAIPRDDWDVPLHAVATEAEWIEA